MECVIHFWQYFVIFCQVSVDDKLLVFKHEAQIKNDPPDTLRDEGQEAPGWRDGHHICAASLERSSLCTHHTPRSFERRRWVSALAPVQVEGHTHFWWKGTLPWQAL